jgi:hypothetical protein
MKKLLMLLFLIFIDWMAMNFKLLMGNNLSRLLAHYGAWVTYCHGFVDRHKQSMVRIGILVHLILL